MSGKSPWLSIWVEPRATIRKIVTDNPKQSLWYLAAIYGFSSLLNSFQSVALGNWVGILPIFLIALILSPIWGYVVFSVWSWVVYWTGKLLKGGGDFQMVRAAYAWSCVPLLLNVILWLLLIALFGRSLFSHLGQEQVLTGGQISLLFCILIGKVVLAIWGLVIYLNALAEVQQYSVLRAIGNVIIAGILVGIVCGVIWTLSLHALGMSAPSHTAFQILHELGSIRNIQGGL